MYRAAVEITFHAVHALRIGSISEEPHEHLWRLHAVVETHQLHPDGLVIDFGLLRRRLQQIVKPLSDADSVNSLPALAGGNPSTERFARYIYDQLAKHLPPRVRLHQITLYETPDCWACYCPQTDDSRLP